MTPSRAAWFLRAFACASSCLVAGALSCSAAAAVGAASSGANGISLAEYHSRLQKLDALLTKCQSAMNPANCQGDQVGPDFQVSVGNANRQIRLGWLHSLLDEAAKGPETAKPATSVDSDSQVVKIANATPLTLQQRLADARQRLAEDERAADAAVSLAANSKSNSGASSTRAELTKILAAKEYQAAVRQPSLLDRMPEKVGKWIGQAMEKLAATGAKSRWLGLTAEIGFVVLLCIGLVWLLIRLEQQGRGGATPLLRPSIGEGAASARDWQLWLAEARQAAAQGDWREAIHLTYWASISRLESTGLWPADRARTPREYLALLAESSEKRPDLTMLTHSFERTWYAGLPADEADFRRAEQVAGRLGAR